ncbi:hypothetical protein [Parabacteroides sp. Marseille-P3160]|uniref:hypothetical protein n=1 Tax=Parabacteroides sp. Marseille-P3160 TaxID=1917887 RepID=UPI0009BC1D9A|nr:hypothetical protein [Parabacteroides sp. Marseille-P3160]
MKRPYKEWINYILVTKQFGYLSPNLYRSLTGWMFLDAGRQSPGGIRGEGPIGHKEGHGSHTLYRLP